MTITLPTHLTDAELTARVIRRGGRRTPNDCAPRGGSGGVRWAPVVPRRRLLVAVRVLPGGAGFVRGRDVQPRRGRAGGTDVPDRVRVARRWVAHRHDGSTAVTPPDGGEP